MLNRHFLLALRGVMVLHLLSSAGDLAYRSIDEGTPVANDKGHSKFDGKIYAIRIDMY